MGKIRRHLYQKRGVFYYERRIPKGLQKRFQRVRVVLSLRTKDEQKAINASIRISTYLETIWNQAELECMGFVTVVEPSTMINRVIEPSISSNMVPTVRASNHTQKSIKLSDALKIYLKLKGHGRSKLFFTHAERNMALAIEVLGDIEIEKIQRSDAGKFRDFLIKRKLSTESIRRVLATVRASINITASEHGLNSLNPFSNTYVPNVGVRNQRLPIPDEDILKIQLACLQQNDPRRWLIALISDTGMRLAEALGLLITDVVIEAEIPHINLVPHKWRPLKTTSSERKIPLVGASLWAAKKAVNNVKGMFLFPDYTNNQICNANSASAALNKWLKVNSSKTYVLHSFRHSMRDRLRSIECPSDIQDAIGGWQTTGIGHGYGKGYSLEVKARWMKLIVLITPNTRTTMHDD